MHRKQLLLGLFAEQSPLTGCEPNAPVEVSITEVTTLLPSRKTSIEPTDNSGEDIVTTPAVSEVDARSDSGMLASPLLTQERDKCDPGRKTRGDVLKRQKIKSRLKMMRGSLVQREN